MLRIVCINASHEIFGAWPDIYLQQAGRLYMPDKNCDEKSLWTKKKPAASKQISFSIWMRTFSKCNKHFRTQIIYDGGEYYVHCFPFFFFRNGCEFSKLITDIG